MQYILRQCCIVKYIALRSSIPPPLLLFLADVTLQFFFVAQITYDARVTVPAWATCLMSALEVAPPVPNDDGDRGETLTFLWRQPVPIPSYLIAIAVGDLESRDISQRCCSL